jgi:hypothetical protein
MPHCARTYHGARTIPNALKSNCRRRNGPLQTARYDRVMRAPLITITCDCGASTEVGYGVRWTCPDCGRTWDTTQIPAAEYDALLKGVRQYRLLVLGPPLALAAILIPLAAIVGIQYAFLLFVLVMGYALLAVPQLRRLASRRMRESTKSWKLRPE